MKFLSSENYAESIEELLKNASSGSEIRCAVAFWGEGAVRYLKHFGERTRIICNLESGATNPDVIKKLIDKKVPVKTLDDLHAKVYLGRDAAIVGSANCSTNGLALEEEAGWVEAGILTTDGQVLTSLDGWFEGIWERAGSIKQRDLKLAKEKWAKRRADRPGRSSKKDRDNPSPPSLLTAMREHPETWEGRNIYFVVSTDDYSPEAVKCGKSEGWKEGDYYEDFDDLPVGTYIALEFDAKKSKGERDGIYKSHDPHSKGFFKRDRRRHTIIHVNEGYGIDGLKLTKNDWKYLERKAVDLHRALKNTRRGDSFWVSFEDARKVLFP
jgi:PLD-like domain